MEEAQIKTNKKLPSDWKQHYTTGLSDITIIAKKYETIFPNVWTWVSPGSTQVTVSSDKR